MKCFRRCAVVIVAIVLSTFPVFGQSTKMSRDETDVRSAIGKWAEAVKGRDQNALDALFADDLFITDFNGGTRGKKEELEILKPSETVKTVSVSNEDIKVRFYGGSKTAVITAVVRMVFDTGGKQTPMAMRYTSVWEKRRGRWQIVVLQTARIASPKS
ncbi:MAG: nuclear transport factor 2 family protein [Pyrinomonadaceae bacterium]|nr:nuclear transport factor 2 family protein [Pyrinomonadaceae bacterium]MBP6212987.1 nuclear transport factor 2 family protein [Pyrinomonadaceae bacterium]